MRVPAIAVSTDFYELAMLAGYRASGLGGQATFELFTRALPPRRGFLVAAGLDQALDYLEHLRFQPAEIAYLRRLPNLAGVDASFFDDYLPRFSFTGDVWAVEEGTPVFPPAPVLRITAPLGEAQLVETALLAIIMFATTIASKAVRSVIAAKGRPVVEFGARRAHGTEAALYASRAACIAGCVATSNVEAGMRFGLDLSGTMAHSWVTAFEDEVEAFREFSRSFGERAVLLLDTYDTLQAAQRVVDSGLRPSAVRLDSGDLGDLARRVRAVLDRGGLHQTRILASGDVDEDVIARLVSEGAPIDGYGVGAAISVAKDAPSSNGVYKLVEIERGGVLVPVAKESTGKATLPGRKQVWRRIRGGTAVDDVIALADEPAPHQSSPLLRHVMRGGDRIVPRESVADAQARCRKAVEQLPPGVRRLDDPELYPVRLSDALEELAERVARQA